MLKQHVSSLTSAGSDADIMSLQPGESEAALLSDHDHLTPDAGALAQTVRDQLAREVADIEAATAALRRAEPALESWSKEPVNAGSKPRPVWLLIGVLWLSTALVTAGAVVAIATLAG
jgi:hypothetical protein